MGIVPATRGKLVGRLSFSFLTSTAGAATAADCTEPVPFVNDCTQWADQGGFPVSHLWASTPFDQIKTTVHPGAQGTGAGAGAVKFLLIVEKEGPFNRLCEDRFFDRVPCIIVTGCGFPDVSTRCLVGKLKSAHPELIVVGVCDYNPYGVALLLTYISSSCPTSNEFLVATNTTAAATSSSNDDSSSGSDSSGSGGGVSSASCTTLLCPGIHWLGMRHTTVQTLAKKCVSTYIHACMRCKLQHYGCRSCLQLCLNMICICFAMWCKN